VAQRALKLAAGLTETDVRQMLSGLLQADVSAKSGADPDLALQSVIVKLARRFAAR
jgi:DNA polymerase III delta subunit